MTQINPFGNNASKQPFSAKDFTSTEKFELLSAYIDNEVTEQERHLVEQWLSSDVQTQQAYQAQLRLSLAIRTLDSEITPSIDPYLKGDSSQEKQHLTSREITLKRSNA